MAVTAPLGAKLPLVEQLAMYRAMRLIRLLDETGKKLIERGDIVGEIHQYVGEEAVAVGVCSALRPDDVITSTHRGHGHILAKGGDLKRAMAELAGKETGYCKGKGGSMHIADAGLGIFGANGIVGAAMAGLRPAVEYEINTLQYVAMDQLTNQMARLRYMMGGQRDIPVTVRVVGAGSSGAAAQHSDSTWAQLIHIDLKVVVPSTPYDVKGLLKTAIRSDDPVVIYEPVALYGTKGEIPDEEFLVPLGVADVKRVGSDVTIVATGHFVREALKAAEELAASQGLSVEVVDPRTLYPLDTATILASVRKTGRLLVADDGYRFCSFASEVAAIVSEQAFDVLKAPVRRVTRPMVPVPFSPPLLQAVTPTGARIAEAVAAVAGAREPGLAVA